MLLLGLGAIYAAPNLYQPDPAVQIRSLDNEATTASVAVEQARQVLQDAGIPIVGTDQLPDGSALIRVDNDENQLRAQRLVNEAVNAQGGEYVVALNRASNTPQWLQDLGGKPMSLGLDLSGGVHFLLQVDMEAYLASVIESTAEGARDSLRKADVAYLPTQQLGAGRQCAHPVAR